ncbi:MAG: methyltransferase domain-containing protein [Acidobacteria bacterium]|nr:methyltransferase domain-containing protein [Acidobacteriota bacterium]
MAGLVLWSGVSAAQAFQLASRPAEEWIKTLENPQRIAGLKIEEVLSQLKLKPGMIVADIGAGTGVFSRPFARAVAPTGVVFAVEIDQGLLEYIAQRAKEESISNIEPVLGKPDDPNLPFHAVDLAFFHDVLHHVEHRQAYLKSLVSYLKPASRVVLIEEDEHNPRGPHSQQEGMVLRKDDVTDWMWALGFYRAAEFDLFKGEKWFAIYERQAPPVMEEMEMHDH